MERARGIRVETDRNENEARRSLESLKGDDLKALCCMFELPLRGSNEEKISRLLSMGSMSYERIVRLARLVQFGYCAEEFIPSKGMKSFVYGLGLSAGGSKHDMFMTAVVSDKSPVPLMLTAMDVSASRKTYKCLFDKPPIWDEDRLKSEIRTWLDFKGYQPQAAKPKTFYVSPEKYTPDPVPKIVPPDSPLNRSADSENASTRYEVDVAISYAGEDGATAEDIAKAMRAGNLRVFFAPYEKANLWGKKLSDVFKETYGRKARFVLVLISSHYAVKDFTDFEFTIARDEARLRREEFILPVRLDNTPLIGLHSDVAYIEYGKSSPEEIAALIEKKLSPGEEQTNSSRFWLFPFTRH